MGDIVSVDAVMIGCVIKTLRTKKLGWSQGAVANACGLTQSAISRIEAGDHIPNVLEMKDLAATLNSKPELISAMCDELRTMMNKVEVLLGKQMNYDRIGCLAEFLAWSVVKR